MDKQYLCPGKILAKDHYLKWYIPVGKYPPYLMYCENCFKEYNHSMQSIQFVLNSATNNRCYWNRNFDDSSICFNNIRISVVNPDNNYRYKKLKSKTSDTVLCVGVPQNYKYMIVIESCDNDTKLTVESIIHRDIENSSYSTPEICHVIDKLNYTEDLIFNDKNDYNLITFKVKKWVKSSETGLSKYFIMKDNSIKFKINLIKNDIEIQKINKEIEKVKSLNNSKVNKIVIVNDFVK